MTSQLDIPAEHRILEPILLANNQIIKKEYKGRSQHYYAKIKIVHWDIIAR
jgi:hypothetical protein